MYNKKVIIDAIKNLNKAKTFPKYNNAYTNNKPNKKNSNNITSEQGVNTPVFKSVHAAPSKIHGKGLFTQEPISKGDTIGVSHIRKKFMKNNEEYQAPFPSKQLGYYNHSESPNVYEVDNGDHIIMKAKRNINPGEELTANYYNANIKDLENPDNFKKGGATNRPKLPNKKNSKAYSRSFEATNRLFAQNPLFSKPKSRKNKIFDPNAKYYANGGEQGCPQGYAFNPKTGECIEWNPTVWSTEDENTSFDPIADIIYMNPNDRPEGMSDEEYNQMYQDQLEHEQLHRLQWLNDELQGESKIPLRMPSPVDNQDYNGFYYYNRRQEEADYLHDYWKNMHPQEAEFIPDDIIYNNETDPAMYQLPWTVEGEARDYEYATHDGMPSFFPKRKKGGALPKAQYGLTGLGDRPGVYFTPFDFRTHIGQTTDFHKNPNYSLTYTIPKLFKKAQLASNPLSFTIGRPYYTDAERLTNPALDYDPIFTQDYHSNPVQQLQYGPNYQQYLQDVSDYTGTPVSNLSQTKVNQYNAAQNLAAVKPKYNKPGAPLTANLEYSLFGNLPGKSGAGPLAGSLTLGAGYAPESGFYGAGQASAYGVFGKRKNKSMSPKTYFEKGLTRKKDRAWIPGLNIMDFSIRQRSPYNDAQTQKILELYKEDIQNGTTRAEDFIQDQADQSSKSPFSISALSPSLTYQRYFEPLGLPVIFSATAGLRNTIEGKDATKTTVGGQWTTKPYGNVRLVVPMDRAIDRLKDLDLPPIKKRKSYYDYVNENEQTDDNNKPPIDNTFPPEDTSTDENTMQPSYDGEGVGKGPCPRGYERLCEECRCTKIKTRRSPLLDKRGIHPYIDGKYLEDGGITKLLSEEETDAMNAMMKARLAYANEFDNPAAQRMIVAPDNPYDFGNGMTGTHYMASMDNYAVPQIQDENGQLVLGDYSPESNEAIRFDRPEDAEYFAEHYKEVSPGFIEAELTPEEIEEYAKGGYIIEDISVPSLTRMQDGGLPKAFEGRPVKITEKEKEKEKESEKINAVNTNIQNLGTDYRPDVIAEKTSFNLGNFIKPLYDISKIKTDISKALAKSSTTQFLNATRPIEMALIKDLKNQGLISETLPEEILTTYPNLLDLATRRGIQKANTVFRGTRPFIGNSNILRSSENTQTELPLEYFNYLKSLPSDVARAAYMSSHISPINVGARVGLDHVIGMNTPLDALYYSRQNVDNPSMEYTYGPLQTELRFPFDFSEGNASTWLQKYREMPFRWKEQEDGSIEKNREYEPGVIHNIDIFTGGEPGNEGAILGLRNQRVLEPVRVRYNETFKNLEDQESLNNYLYEIMSKKPLEEQNQYLIHFNNEVLPQLNVPKDYLEDKGFTNFGPPESLYDAQNYLYHHNRYLKDVAKKPSNIQVIPYSPFSFKFKEGGQFELGDEVELTKEQLKKLQEEGYTFEIVK